MSEMQQAIERQPEELERLIEDRDPVAAAAARLEPARRIVLAGTGTSWHAANHGVWLFAEASVETAAIQAIDAVLYFHQLIRDGDAVVILSHGNTKTYTSRLGERLRAHGTPFIVIGGTHAANVDIPTVERERSAAFTFSHTAAMLRVAQLARHFGAPVGDLGSVPGLVEAAIGAEIAIDELPARGVEVIGSGPNQWTAAEGSLKIREASYFAAQGLNVEQFLHGPGAAVDERDLVVGLRALGPGLGRLDAVTAAARVAGARVVTVGPFETAEELSVFPLTVCVQRIALALALQAGVNPDLFRTETHNAWRDVGL
jgi:glucosamine--fructose-6-phosphate aminotransferase (isomerizing)